MKNAYPILIEEKIMEEFRELSKEEGRSQGKMIEILVENYKKQKGMKDND